MTVPSLEDLPGPVLLQIGRHLDSRSMCALAATSPGVREEFEAHRLVGTTSLCEAIRDDIARYERRFRFDLFTFRKTSPGVRCAEMQWLALEKNGLSNLAAAGAMQVATTFAPRSSSGGSPSALTEPRAFDRWIFAWLGRYARHMAVDLSLYLVGYFQPLQVRSAPRHASTAARHPLTVRLFHSLDHEYLMDSLNLERLSPAAADTDVFLFNSVLDCSASLEALVRETVSAAFESFSVPQAKLREEVGYPKTWHLFACDFGTLCRWHMRVVCDAFELKSNLHACLERVIGKTSEEEGPLESKRYALHGLELCHWACVYGIYVDVEKYLPAVLRANATASDTCKRFIIDWILKTENARPRARGQILLAEFPRVLAEVLEWIQSY